VHAWTGRSAAIATAQDEGVPQSSAGDVREHDVARRIVRRVRPSAVFHLAGVTPARGGGDAATMMTTNVLGTRNVLDAIWREAPEAVTVVVSSSAVYGQGGARPLDETQPLCPVNEHGASKAAQEMTALGLGRQHGLSIIRARAFNLVGPGEPEGLVCSSLARQIASAELGLTEPVIRVGRLDSRRDFTDVRDAVNAFILLRNSGHPGDVYNVCSGCSTAIAELLERLLAMSRISLRVERKDVAVSRGDIDTQQGSYAKLERETGWRPTVSLDRTLSDLLDWWRTRLAVHAHHGG
jgi:GDP-4-dehydro-6-deoxy-D-mannose reductase